MRGRVWTRAGRTVGAVWMEEEKERKQAAGLSGWGRALPGRIMIASLCPTRLSSPDYKSEQAIIRVPGPDPCQG